jgi:hypothetical protein
VFPCGEFSIKDPKNNISNGGWAAAKRRIETTTLGHMKQLVSIHPAKIMRDYSTSEVCRTPLHFLIHHPAIIQPRSTDNCDSENLLKNL